MKKYIVLFIFGLLLFIFTFFISLNYFNRNKSAFVEAEVEKVNKLNMLNEVYDEPVKETSNSEEKIGVNTEIRLKRVFSKCDHSDEKIIDYKNSFINLNEEGLANRYPEYKIENFSNESVDLIEEVEGYCNNHYKIKLGEDFVEVFKINSNEEEELFLVTSISRDYLTENDINKLSLGVDIVGFENINLALEDYE